MRCKTRATEIIIRSAFLSGRTNLAVIVAPFRALCHDIRGDLARAFSGENVLLDEVSDAFQIDFIFDTDTAPSTILIVTPEKLLYMLRRSPELANFIGLLIYDEGHLFDSPGRGTTYELLLTSLKLTIPDTTQVILISAVIENAGAVANWLVGSADRVVDGKGLTVATKNVAFASWRTERGQLRYVSPLNPDDDEFFVPRIIERIGSGRKLILLTLFVVGLYGLFVGQHALVLLWIALPLFSPKAIGLIAFYSGRLLRRPETNS